MTTLALPAAGTTRSGSARRIAALARAELTLLRRNPLALFNAFVVPVALGALLHLSEANDGGPFAEPGAAAATAGSRLVVLIVSFALLSIVYLNGLMALVARRQDGVLKRLRTGEVTDGEIFAGTAAGGVGLLWVQTALALASAALFLHLGMPVNPVLVLIGLAAGTFVVSLLAALTSIVTRTVEMAQVTVMPFLLVTLMFGGLKPANTFPGALRWVAEVLPMTHVLELITLGLTGEAPSGAHVSGAATFAQAIVPLLALGAWAAVGLLVTRRWFRWEPRQ